MPSIHGNFAMHRVKTYDGKDAIMLVPDKGAELQHGGDGECDDISAISFENVIGGEYPRDAYLTITMFGGQKIHLGPYVAVTQ